MLSKQIISRNFIEIVASTESGSVRYNFEEHNNRRILAAAVEGKTQERVSKEGRL